MAIVTTNDGNYKFIADALRNSVAEWSGQRFKPSQMAGLVNEACRNARDRGYDRGYNEGYSVGKEEGFAEGKQGEYDAFWDAFQINGNKNYYNYAFAYEGWTDANYNPKYPIVCSHSSTTAGQSIFRSSYITDSKVPITITGNGQAAFYTCKMQIIRKLIVTEDTSYVNMFYGTPIREITVEGVIGKTFECTSTRLSIASAKNIISCLKNYNGTDKEYTYSVKFSSGVWAALEADSSAPDGTTWAEYVSSLGWLT